MSKHTYRELTPAERDKVRGHREQLEQEKDQIIARGQAFFERHERLRDVVAMLKAEREAQGVSLAELGRRTQINASALSRLENDRGANPTIDTLMKIAQALGRELRIALAEPEREAA